jgi:hypothetical protein
VGKKGVGKEGGGGGKGLRSGNWGRGWDGYVPELDDAGDAADVALRVGWGGEEVVGGLRGKWEGGGRLSA